MNQKDLLSDIKPISVETLKSNVLDDCTNFIFKKNNKIHKALYLNLIETYYNQQLDEVERKTIFVTIKQYWSHFLVDDIASGIFRKRDDQLMLLRFDDLVNYLVSQNIVKKDEINNVFVNLLKKQFDHNTDFSKDLNPLSIILKHKPLFTINNVRKLFRKFDALIFKKQNDQDVLQKIPNETYFLLLINHIPNELIFKFLKESTDFRKIVLLLKILENHFTLNSTDYYSLYLAYLKKKQEHDDFDNVVHLLSLRLNEKLQDYVTLKDKEVLKNNNFFTNHLNVFSCKQVNKFKNQLNSHSSTEMNSYLFFNGKKWKLSVYSNHAYPTYLFSLTDHNLSSLLNRFIFVLNQTQNNFIHNTNSNLDYELSTYIKTYIKDFERINVIMDAL